MIAEGQQHIEHLVLQVWDANTKDPTHSTGTLGIVSFHVHEHENGRNVTKGSDDIGMKSEEVAQEGIICRHANCKLKEFSHKQMDEGVCIPWLVWTRYDPNTKNVVLLEALLWREIVVENEENPHGMFLPFEWSEAICGKPECNITMI